MKIGRAVIVSAVCAAAVQLVGCGSNDPGGDPVAGMTSERVPLARPACIDTQLCIRGFRWSPQRCKCVPELPHDPHAPHSPHGPHVPHQP